MDATAAPMGSVNTSTPERLHYLDWLRVSAILMVFLFHAVHPFDFGDWHIKNIEQSEILTIILVLLSLWGMPFFFLAAGAGSWFALQRRTAGQYIRERFKRLLIPYLAASIVFVPFATYFEWGNRVWRGEYSGSVRAFAGGLYDCYLGLGFSPRWLAFGQHLWFLGFLFAFALITIPLFQWLKRERGRRVVSRLAAWSEKRGGLLLFIVPLLVVNLSLQPFFPIEHDWADFGLQMSFFVLGFVLFADDRYVRAIRRDGWFLMSAGTAAVIGLLAMYLTDLPVMAWSETPGLPQFYLVHGLATVIALCYSLFFVFVGIRFLNRPSALLLYAREAVLPFFILHQPVIIVIAFFVVQWNAAIGAKALAVVLSSFVVAFGLYELVIRRIRPLRTLFGMRV